MTQSLSVGLLPGAPPHSYCCWCCCIVHTWCSIYGNLGFCCGRWCGSLWLLPDCTLPSCLLCGCCSSAGPGLGICHVWPCLCMIGWDVSPVGRWGFPRFPPCYSGVVCSVDACCVRPDFSRVLWPLLLWLGWPLSWLLPVIPCPALPFGLA